MTESRCDILHNEAALNALKRHQLQSLTKRYGLKSNGKNSDMVQRLQEFGQTMSPNRSLYSPGPSATPGPNDFFSDYSQDTPLQRPTLSVHQPGGVKSSTEPWEVLSDSGASLISPTREKSDSMRSWKSARNGQKLDEFGGSGEMSTSGSMSSIKSLASSLKRSASQHLMSRSRRNSVNLLAADPLPQAEEPEVVEEMADSLPPSPASTVGVPRRYSDLSLLERPSTIRLVASPPPPEPESGDDDDDLPFVGSKSIQLLKERKSMAPLRSMDGAFSGPSLSRKSMPAISGTSSASFSIYPPLPPIPAQFQLPRVEQHQPSMPGALPISPPKQTPTFVFGTPQAVSNQQFSEAGRAILAQMNAKMPAGLVFNEELLKGKQAGIDKLVKTSDLGEGGWGLTGGAGKVDRYADAHQREFSKMRSISKQNLGASTSTRFASSSTSRDLASSTSTSRIASSSTSRDLASSTSAPPTRTSAKASTVTLNAGSTPGKRKRSSVHLPSAPNGAALPTPVETQADVPVPEAKKRRMSVLGSLADAGRSLLSLEGTEKKVKTRRRSSLIPGGFKSKFGWLSRKKRSIPPPQVHRSRTPIMPRKTSVYAPREMPVVKPKFDLNASLSKSTNTTTTSKRDHTDYMSSTIAQKQRQASSSAQTTLSVSTTRSRPRIPDFGPPSSAGSTLNTLGLPKPTSSSLASSMRKQSQADILKKVRAAPPPPPESSEPTTRPKPTSMSTSRLHAPTASSLARMQATVKPTGARPMPSIPRSISTSSTTVPTIPRSTSSTIPPVPTIPAGPFANASARDNVQFQSNFNVPKPHKPTSLAINSPRKGTSQLKSPMKSASSSRLRAQASGLHAVKSRPDLKKEREVAGRKAEIKARMGRFGEERELRRMLGGDKGEDVDM